MRGLRIPARLGRIATLAVLAGIAGLTPAIGTPRQAAAQGALEGSRPATYWCPMHPDVRGDAGTRCRLCGMELVAKPVEMRPYSLDLSWQSGAPAPGRRERLRFVVRAPQSGAPVERFEPLHERLVHLFIISHDLSYFEHVHPTPARGGAFEQIVTLPAPGAYRLIADFFPADGAPQVIQRTVVTAGYTGRVTPAAAPPVDVDDTIVDGVQVRAYVPEPMAGREQLITFELFDAGTGKPIEDVEPFLGAAGHLLVVSADLETALHSHAVPELSTDRGPRLVFQLLFPRAGPYRCWVQFQRKGRVSTANITVTARPRAGARR
jgi:hypothetical protein